MFSRSLLSLRWLLMALLVFGAIGMQAAPPGQQVDTPDGTQSGGETDQARDGAVPDTQDASDASPVPIFRSGINFIRVDAIVTDGDGNHVTDLEESEFEVYEDDERQEIETFELVEISALPDADTRPASRIATRADEEREAARTDVRVVVIFFDDYHVRFVNGQRASLMITEFLRNNLRPTDLVAVMYPLTSVSDVHLTRNHDSVIDEVERFFGRKYDYDPKNSFEDEYASYPTELIERIRNDVSLSALNGLMIHLGGLRDGRKSVLLVSEGYTNYLPPQLREAQGQFNPNVVDPYAAENSIEERLQFFSESDMLVRIRDVYQTANRFNASIYALDPRGLAVDEYDMSQPSIVPETNRRMLRMTQDTLYLLSEQSDGRAIVNRNDLTTGLQQMMRDSSAYYLLGYRSSKSPTDGRFHDIDVRVTRDGVQVRSRPGYWAVTERDAERALRSSDSEPPKAVDVALSALAEPTRGYLVRTWVGTSRGTDGRTRVTFVWEPTRVPGGSDDPVRVLLTAMGEAGGAFYRGRIPERVDASVRGLAGSQVRADAGLAMTTFDVDPGMMHLSVAVEGESGEVLDRDREEIDVPDFSGGAVTLSTPAFVRARNALEWRALVDDWNAVPTAAREFRRTERLLLRFEAYAQGPEVPRVEAWLVNRAGDRMYPLVVQPAEAGQPYQVDVQPTGLPPGAYVVELRAAAAGTETTRLVAFRLRS